MIAQIAKEVGKARVALLLLMQLVRNASSMGVALLLSGFLDALQSAIVTKDMRSVTVCLGLSCAYALGLGMVTLVSEYLKAAFVRGAMVGIRDRVAQGALLRASPSNNRSIQADYATLLGQSMDTLEAQWLKTALEIIDAVEQAVVACAILVWINPLAALLSIAAMAVPAIVPKLFGKKLGELQRSIVGCTEAYNSCVRDMLQGIEVVRSYHLERIMSKQHRCVASDLEGGKGRLTEAMGWVYGVSNSASVSMQFVIMSISGWFAVNGLVSLGSIVAITQLSGQVIAAASQLSGKLGQLRSVRPILMQVESVSANLGTEDVVGGSANEGANGGRGSVERPAKETKKRIVLSHVSYSYPDSDAPAVSDVSACFEAGRKYAIVGPSGCGKSTLLKLIAGQLQPTTGSVLVNGEKHAASDAAFIHQDVFLFNSTLRNNISLWGRYSDDEIHRAVRLAGLEKVIDGLPEGLETPVGENGARFSGGECQRIAIARALLRNKDVLLVDEATSSLDAAMARQVEDAFLGLDDVTVIEITHRLDEKNRSRFDEVLELRVPSGSFPLQK